VPTVNTPPSFQQMRNIADYRDADISEKRATRILGWAREVVGKVEEVIGYVNVG